MTPHRKINIASEKIRHAESYFPSNHCCQVSIKAGQRPGNPVIIHCFLFLRQERVHVSISLYIKSCVERRHSKIFKLLKSVYSYGSLFASLYYFDKIRRFPVRIPPMPSGRLWGPFSLRGSQ